MVKCFRHAFIKCGPVALRKALVGVNIYDHGAVYGAWVQVRRPPVGLIDRAKAQMRMLGKGHGIHHTRLHRLEGFGRCDRGRNGADCLKGVPDATRCAHPQAIHGSERVAWFARAHDIVLRHG